jgi:hypothetical protein
MSSTNRKWPPGTRRRINARAIPMARPRMVGAPTVAVMRTCSAIDDTAVESRDAPRYGKVSMRTPGVPTTPEGDGMNNETRWEMRWAVDTTHPTSEQRGAAGRETAEELLAAGWEPFATLPDSPEAPPVVYFRRRILAS